MAHKPTISVSSYLLLTLLVGMLFSACSKEKDSFINRTYHNTTAHYNGYFNSREGMKLALQKAEDTHEEDYDKILPIYVELTEEEATKLLPALEKSIEKSSFVIDRHKMEVSKRSAKEKKRPILNKWIDENYMIIGKANFFKGNYFKAEEFFGYVMKNYEDPEIQANASTWLARTYIAQQRLSKANTSIIKADNIKNAPDEAKAELLFAKSDYHRALGDIRESARFLEDAIGYIKKKKDQARPTFILAQMKEELNKSAEAVELYSKVVDLKPKYEMEFYARIKQATAFSRTGGSSAQIREMLDKMLKDDKNIEYQDQIYYALAEIDLEERLRDEALVHLEQSLEAHAGNERQQTKTYMLLADVYFDDRAYAPAQAYYDSTRQKLDKDHPRFSDIENKAESLTELVGYLNTIASQDSLLRLSQLPEDERIKEVRRIRDLDIAAAARKLKEQQEAAAAGDASAFSGTGTFWAYNATLRASGLQNFKERWGDRKLEDNWRRKTKISTFSDNEDPVENEVPLEDVDPESLVPTMEEYLANIPTSDEDVKASTELVTEAYYYAGVIYKERLDDFDNAIESFEVLSEDYEGSTYHPMAYYQLYRSYFNKEQEGYKNPLCSTCNSEYWKDLVLEVYPGSEYAELVNNPDYKAIEDLRKAEENTAYTQLLGAYYERNYDYVTAAADSVIGGQPENHLLAKYYLIRGMSAAETDKRYNSFSRAIDFLQQTVKTFPDTEESEKAKEILGFLEKDTKKEVKTVGKTEEEMKKEEEGKKEGENELLADSPFNCDLETEHWFAISFPKGGSPMNEVKKVLADYNKVYHTSSSYTVSGNPLGDFYLVMVKKFPSSTEAMKYYGAFQTDLEELETVKGEGFDSFVITKKNFITLFKNKNLEELKTFFDACYTSSE